MLVVAVKEGEPIDKALKKLKRKFDMTRTIRQFRAKQEFFKKSILKRKQIQKAIYTQRFRLKQD